MSRSRRKLPIIGYTMAASEKWWKRKYNRSWRRAVAVALSKGREVLPDRREIRKYSWGPKDGKGYWPGLDEKYMRK